MAHVILPYLIRFISRAWTRTYLVSRVPNSGLPAVSAVTEEQLVQSHSQHVDYKHLKTEAEAGSPVNPGFYSIARMKAAFPVWDVTFGGSPTR